MTHHSKTYLPAAGHDWALPFYDAIMRIFGLDSARRRLLQQADIHPSQRILDLGCGTGTLAVQMKRLHPDVEYVGLDPDPKALARARRKVMRAGVSGVFDQGSAHELPYADASFDRVVSSFMFHHLLPDQKPGALREIRRVLKPRGSLHLLDFGGPDASARGLRGRFLSVHAYTHDNFGEAIPTLMRGAGFTNVDRVGEAMVLAGPVAYYRGQV